MLAVGEPAPSFVASSSAGAAVRLADFQGRRLIVFFFPKAGSLGCTRESLAFAGRYDAFQQRGVSLVGVSVDDAYHQVKFVGRCSLPFPLLPDPSRQLSRQFGVLGPFGFARRVTFIVGPDGRIEHVIDSRLPGVHVDRCVRLLLDAEATPPGSAAGGAARGRT